MGESNRGETLVRIAKHRNGTLETIKLRALLHIQKFTNWNEDRVQPVIGLPSGGWSLLKMEVAVKKLYIQTGSKMNDLSTEREDPF